MDIRDGPKRLPELRMASVDGVAIPLHGRCDAFSTDNHAALWEVFGNSNEGFDR